MNLHKLRTLVTGSSQGLGLAIARAFAHEGASVLLCARDLAELERAAIDVRQAARGDARVSWMRADVAQPEDVGTLVERAQRDWGGLDILVCNAAVHGPKGPVEAVDWAEWTEAIRINLY